MLRVAGQRLAGVAALLLAAFVLAACSPEVERVPATQTTIRIQAGAEVRAALQRLRVRTGAARGAAWVTRNDLSFPAQGLHWPVEIVVTPPSEARADERFEFVADALGSDDDVLVQARVITGFVLREQRLVVLQLAACGQRTLGFVCEQDAECLGPSCMACVAGECAQTPRIEPSSLDHFEATAEPDGADAGMDAQAPRIEPDASETTDAAVAPDAEQACGRGSERDDAGACADIDECARGLDDCSDDPPACINALDGLGFMCACPTGYRGTGKGPDGCTDIDECTERTHSCDTLAPCDNTRGGYACGSCPSGFTSTAGGGCVDIDECATNNGGCDTNPMATCQNREGATNTCACLPGYAGNGVGADGCVDPCSSNPCGSGLECRRSSTSTPDCVASCASSEIGCQPGDRCVADADCRTGGDTTASCEPSAKVCVRVCPATTIVSQTNLEAARYCKEIDGDLRIEPDFPTLDASALPYLTRVRGSLLAVNPFGSPAAQSITVGNLQTVDGKVHFTALTNLTHLSLPRLTSASEVAVVLIPTLTRLSMPQLTTVDGVLALGAMQQLGQLDIGRLRTVAGEVKLTALCKLPWSQVQALSTLGSVQNIIGIGCCNSSSDRNACGSGSGCNCN